MISVYIVMQSSIEGYGGLDHKLLDEIRVPNPAMLF